LHHGSAQGQSIRSLLGRSFSRSKIDGISRGLAIFFLQFPFKQRVLKHQLNNMLENIAISFRMATLKLCTATKPRAG
jgi:hypothetical protein